MNPALLWLTTLAACIAVNYLVILRIPRELQAGAPILAAAAGYLVGKLVFTLGGY